ncbi:MAG: hypothetical protein V8R15_01345 [Bacilli bacterium]
MDKFATYHFENYLDVMVLKDSPIVLKCRVSDVISLEGIEEESFNICSNYIFIRTKKRKIFAYE